MLFAKIRTPLLPVAAMLSVSSTILCHVFPQIAMQHYVQTDTMFMFAIFFSVYLLTLNINIQITGHTFIELFIRIVNICKDFENTRTHFMAPYASLFPIFRLV